MIIYTRARGVQRGRHMPQAAQGRYIHTHTPHTRRMPQAMRANTNARAHIHTHKLACHRWSGPSPKHTHKARSPLDTRGKVPKTQTSKAASRSGQVPNTRILKPQTEKARSQTHTNSQTHTQISLQYPVRPNAHSDDHGTLHATNPTAMQQMFTLITTEPCIQQMHTRTLT